jgi:NAD(P)-dependent dehydrogenase (short-subunit alcohol dehydrogenase family)
MLDGKLAVVTGGGRGLGRVVATRLAAAGAEVVACGRDADALAASVAAIEASGGTARAEVADVTDPDALAGQAPDVVVANSGVAGPTASLWEVDPEEWEATFAVNVRGVFLTYRALLPAMLARGSGSLVTIGSMTGKRPLPGRTPYAASKTALIGLTRTLAHEIGDRGLRANLVSPGAIEGERIERVIANLAAHESIDPAEARDRFEAPSPLRRLVGPDDVADAVVFLASDAARGITGEDLNVSAGTVMY